MKKEIVKFQSEARGKDSNQWITRPHITITPSPRDHVINVSAKSDKLTIQTRSNLRSEFDLIKYYSDIS